MDKLKLTNRQLLAKMWAELAENDDAYFEYLQTSNDCWTRVSNNKSPVLNNDLTRWRVTHPPKTWHPKPGKYLVTTDGTVIPVAVLNSYRSFTERGLVRETEKQAKEFSEDLRIFARLSAWVTEHNYNKPFVLHSNDNFYVYQIGGYTWHYNSSNTCYYPDRVYMTQNGAIELSKQLNNGVVQL